MIVSAGVIQAGSGKATAAGPAAQAGKGTNKENEGESARPAGNKTYLPVHNPVAQPPPALNTRYSFFLPGLQSEQASCVSPFA